MRVWFAANIPRDSQGGVARNMAGFAIELRRRGHEVTSIFTGASPLSGNYLIFSVLLAVRLLRARPRERPAVIVARSTDGLCCAILTRLTGMHVQVILHNHGWEERVYDLSKSTPRSPLRPFFTWKSRLVRFPLLRLTLALSQGCLCGTIDEIRWLRRRYLWLTPKFAYVPNGVTMPAIDIRHDFDRPSFLCVGAAGWRKNSAYTIEVFRALKTKIPNARLTFVGSGPESSLGLARSELDALGIDVVPLAPMDAMPSYYARCSFLITSSLFEGGHGLAVLEAMAHGCVVFSSAIPSAREIIVDGQNGVLLEGADPTDDAQRIVEILSRHPALLRLSEQAINTARRNRWERQGARMDRLLRRMVSSEGRGV